MSSRHALRPEPNGPAIRLGLSSVRGIGSETAERIAAGQPWSGMEDLVRRAGASRAQLEALATAGALDDLPAGNEPVGNGRPATNGKPATGNRAPTGNRRSLVWAAGAAAQATPGRLPGMVTGTESPPLPTATPWEDVADDLWALGMTPDVTAMELARPVLSRQGVVPSGDLGTVPSGDRVTVGGVVTHRQHPESAHGAVFLNLEDETGMVNVICSRGAWVRWRSVARFSPL